jgi:glycosyltransferase involved in cell wall biosynthesis
MTVRHFLLTRFNLRAKPHLPPPDDHWLRERAELFSSFTAPSVRAQSGAPFSWFIFCDVDSPPWLLRVLSAEAANAKLVMLPAFSSRAIAEAVSAAIPNGASQVITTRLDNDDAIGRGFMSVVQQRATGCRTLEAVNVLNGCQLSHNKLCLRSDPSNAFISLVEDPSVAQIRTVFDRPHQEWINTIPLRQVVTDAMWLQVIHQRNLANRLSGIPARPSSVQRQFAFALPPDPPRLELARQRVLGGTRLAIRVVRSPRRLLWLSRVAVASVKGREDSHVRVSLVQSALPSYRAAFLSELMRRVPETEVYVGTALFDATVRTAGSLPVPTTNVRNVFLGGRRLLWQRGVFATGVRADVAMLELNPRILSVWATLLVRRILGRPTILWGHAWPRRGAGTRTEPLRALLRRQADVLVAYTETQAKELRTLMPGHKIFAAPNAIYRVADMWAETVARPRSFIYVGRLVAEKNPALLVDAFARAASRLGDTRLVFVGAGPEEQALTARARAMGIAERMDIVGPVTDVGQLRSLYSHALASVSPGYVGLSLIQSLGFGVPMIVADVESHSPEIEAARESGAVTFFGADSVTELAEALVKFYEEEHEWIVRRDEITTWCRDRYSAERMADGFVEAIRIAQSYGKKENGEGLAGARIGADG